MVQESLLESCLYATTKTTPPGMPDGEFSREWWLYQQRLGDPRDGCSFDGKVHCEVSLGTAENLCPWRS